MEKIKLFAQRFREEQSDEGN